MRMRVGFIGLGSMGGPMAANLARAQGVELGVWNRTAAKAEAFAAEHGCRVAATPAQLAADSDVLVTMVADGAALEELYFDAGAAAALGPGGLAIDMSTIGPLAAQSLGERLEPVGVRFVDAPVSGSTAAATAATLTIFVGASDEDFAAAAPVLAHLGDPVIHVGARGRGALIKIAVNNLIYGIAESVAESLVLAERAGVPREQAYEAFLNSAAAAPMMAYRRQEFVHPGEQPVAFTLNLTEKDLRLTLELADVVGAPMPQAAVNREVTRQAIDAGLGDQDLAALAVFLRELPTKEPA